MPKTTFTPEQSAQFERLLSRMTLKKVSSRQTQDGGALKADFYIDGKRIDTFEDEGFGGGAFPMNFSSDGGKLFLSLIETEKLPTLMQADWDFLKPGDITPDQLADWFVSELFNRQQKQKAEARNAKALQRAYTQKLTWSAADGTSQCLTFKGFKSIAAVCAKPAGVNALQKRYDEICHTLTASKQRFLTPTSALLPYGIKVNTALHSA